MRELLPRSRRYGRILTPTAFPRVKKPFVAALFAGAGLLAGAPTTARAQAQPASPQVAPDFPAAPAAPRPADDARTRRRQQMSPEDAARDQQLQILEARTGNTSFASRTGPERQFDKGNGAFTVRKFKSKSARYNMKKGQSRPVVGIDPKGERLIEKKHRKHFLFF